MNNKVLKIKKSIRDGNFINRVATVGFGMLGYSNLKIANLEMKYKTFRYLKRNYSSYIENMTYIERCNDDTKKNNNIWICWLQGIDNAPPLVKRCIESVYKHMPDSNIHIITHENLWDYIEFPNFIKEKWIKGIIDNTKLSNMIRMELLIKYGGLWVDSTIFLTGPIPDWVFKTNIFMYSIDSFEDITRIYNNYFIYAEEDDAFLKTLRDIHYCYWKKENKIREYFLWHLLATLCAEKYPDHFNNMFFIPDAIPHMLSKVIMNEFSKDYWDKLCDITPIHKLSNKFSNPNNGENTYYGKILNGEL